MKKIFLTVGICFLMIFMPLSLGYTTPFMKLSKNKSLEIENGISSVETSSPRLSDDPPDWANGNFSGVWGLDIWGETHIPIGWLYGYWKNMKIGYFYGAFAEFGEEDFDHYLTGFFFGPFMFGKIGIIDEQDNETQELFVGLGGYNQTHFYWRIMGQTGPTFFMYGVYTRFN